MSASAIDYREIRRLLLAASVGDATPAEWRALEQQIRDSDLVREYVVLLLDQMSSLEWRAMEPACLPFLGADSVDVERRATDGRAPMHRRFFSRERRPLAILLAASLAATVLISAWWLRRADDDRLQHARTDVRAGKESRQPENFEGELIARLIELTPDARWAEGGSPDEFLLRLSSGRKLELLSGWARIQFAAGAMVILHGPCEFMPTGPNSAVLTRGRITGLAAEGNFHLKTPSAQVVDLGTEFGVAVDDTASTDVIVFEGEVSVSPSDQKKKRVDAVFLDGGATVHISADGELATGVHLDSSDFLRSLPEFAADGKIPSSAASLSLVDLISGDSGRGKGLAGAIDPLTGKWDRRPWLLTVGPGLTATDRKYHPASTHPMVDGLFIPARDGKDVMITSAGHRVDLPPCEGWTWGPVWARRQISSLTPSETGDFWGTGTVPYIVQQLEVSRSGVLGLHPNVGVTFDLHACDEKIRGRIRSLSATLVNLDAGADTGPAHVQAIPKRTADFRVFVDGELKYSKLDFGRDMTGVPVEVELHDGDRFLTLVTTDAGNTNKSDHILLVDPILAIGGLSEPSQAP